MFLLLFLLLLLPLRAMPGATSGFMSSYAWRLLVIAFCQTRRLVPAWPSVAALAPLVASALRGASTPDDAPTAALGLFPTLPSLLWPEEASAEEAATEAVSVEEAAGGGLGGGNGAAVAKRKRDASVASPTLSDTKRPKAADATATAASPQDDAPAPLKPVQHGPRASGPQAGPQASSSAAGLFYDFLRWVAGGIDYKGRQVICLQVSALSLSPLVNTTHARQRPRCSSHGARVLAAATGAQGDKSAGSGAPLLARGLHAWARLRLADPVESGRDLGTHFTK
jgi:hypothetical protein